MKDVQTHLSRLGAEAIEIMREVANLMTDAGLIVITAFISPFRSERQMVRDMIAPGEFVEVFVDTPLSVAEDRDVKGRHAKACSGQLKNFTGIDSPYEAPETPEIHIDTTAMLIDDAAEQIVKQLLGE
jgi:bifunctional enzyme CysN/CysC